MASNGDKMQTSPRNVLGELFRQAMCAANDEGYWQPHGSNPTSPASSSSSSSPTAEAQSNRIPSPRKGKSQKMTSVRRQYQRILRMSIITFGLTGRRHHRMPEAVAAVMADFDIQDKLSNRHRVRHDIGEAINNVRRYENRLKKIAQQKELEVGVNQPENLTTSYEDHEERENLQPDNQPTDLLDISGVHVLSDNTFHYEDHEERENLQPDNQPNDLLDISGVDVLMSDNTFHYEDHEERENLQPDNQPNDLLDISGVDVLMSDNTFHYEDHEERENLQPDNQPNDLPDISGVPVMSTRTTDARDAKTRPLPQKTKDKKRKGWKGWAEGSPVATKEFRPCGGRRTKRPNPRYI